MATTNATYPLRKGYSQWGAQIGRSDDLPADTNAPVKLSLVRLRWCDGDYDSGGAYWGHTPGTWIWRALGDSADGETVVEMYVRASCRDDAKARIVRKLPGARFYR